MAKENELNYSLKIQLSKSKTFFGPGVVELLQGIEKTESINLAAKNMTMSYNKAWRIIKTAEQELGHKLITRHVGGASGGGSTVTKEGKKLIAQYLIFENNVYAMADKFFKEIFVDEQKDVECIERNT